jgi:hypothetical protein
VAGTPLLTYEQGLVHTESMCLQTFAGQTSVPVPKLVGAGVGDRRTGGVVGFAHPGDQR